jgi:hypothetical protein
MLASACIGLRKAWKAYIELFQTLQSLRQVQELLSALEKRKD